MSPYTAKAKHKQQNTADRRLRHTEGKKPLEGLLSRACNTHIFQGHHSPESLLWSGQAEDMAPHTELTWQVSLEYFLHRPSMPMNSAWMSASV